MPRGSPWRRCAPLIAALALALTPALAAAQPAQPRSSVVVVKKAPPAPEPPPPAPPVVPRLTPPTPAPPPPALVPPPAVSSAPSGGAKVLPWITLGGSVAAGVAGAVFMGKAISAVGQEVKVEIKDTGNGTSTVTLPPEYQDQQRRILTNGVVGTVLLSTATAGAIASLISLLSD